MVNKYWQVFKISFQQEFTYKLTFIMWRVRNVIQIAITFFLWSNIFSDPNKIIFGYDRGKILTYVFGLMIVKAFVFSSKSSEVAGDITNGNLSNYLVKPLNYFKYWFTRDLASKFLNLIFATGEFLLLFIILKPELFLQTDPFTMLAFGLSLILAILLYFCFLFIVSSIPFWAPELGWGSQFLITVVLVEFLSGSLFPLDILPSAWEKIIMFTPFPYLLFYPVEVYLGKITGAALIFGFAISLFWTLISWLSMLYFWKKGIKIYQAFGR